jgi:hypothetical protein
MIESGERKSIRRHQSVKLQQKVCSGDITQINANGSAQINRQAKNDDLEHMANFVEASDARG